MTISSPKSTLAHLSSLATNLSRSVRFVTRALAALAFAGALAAEPAHAQTIGTDLAGLYLCLGGDCEARGSYAADPYGWTNPATIPVAILKFLPRGASASGGYFRLSAGAFAADIESHSVSLAYEPFVFQATLVMAQGQGIADTLPGVHLKLSSSLVRLSLGVDLDHVLPMRGWAIGWVTSLPGTGSAQMKSSVGGFKVSDSTDDRDVDLAFGLHWHGGEKDWFMAGAFVNGLRNDSKVTDFDPFTGVELTTHRTTSAWFIREGVSMLPFVPFGMTEGMSPLAEWLKEIRLGIDLEQTNISRSPEEAATRERGYFGVDWRVLPDSWNPASRFLRFVLIAGTDTAGGWGLGLGLYGNGPLSFFTCNPAYSSRPIARSLGDRADIWAVTCAVAFPL